LNRGAFPELRGVSFVTKIRPFVIDITPLVTFSLSARAAR
jgi:hypothetical protein